MRSSELASQPALAKLDTAFVGPALHSLPAVAAAPPADAEEDESPATVTAASPPAAAAALPTPASPPPRRRSSLSPASDALPQPPALEETLSAASSAQPTSATTSSSSSGCQSASSSRSRRADDSSRGIPRGEYATDSDSLGRSGSWTSTTPTSPGTEEQAAEPAQKGLLGAEPHVQHAPAGMSSSASGRTIDALHANDLMHERAALRARAARATPTTPASRVPRKSSSSPLPPPPPPAHSSSPLPSSSSGSVSSPSQIPVRRGNTPSPGRLLSSPVPPRQASQLAPERPAAASNRSVSPASASASSRASRSTRRSGVSASELSHRNKPLPSPGQPSPPTHLVPALPAPQPPSPSSPLLPDYLVHMYSQEALADAQQAAAVEAAKRPSASSSLVVPSPRPSLGSPSASGSSSVESRNSSSHSPQRPSLRSTISRSSKAFMSSMRGNSSSSSREHTSAAGSSRSPSSSQTSSPSVRPASPVRKVPSDAGHGLSPPPSAPPRPHSSFGFRRKPKTPLTTEIPATFLSRNSTSASATMPPATASGSASVSRKSTLTQSATAVSPPPPPPNRSRSRFSQRFSLNDPAWSRAAAAATPPVSPRTRRDVSPPSSIRAHVAVEHMSPQRPSMRRLRSNSVGQMQRVYLDAEAQRELGVEHLELARVSDSQTAAQSGAVLRASIIDQEPLLSPTEVARLARLSRLAEDIESQIEGRALRDGSSAPQSRRESRSLHKRPSVTESKSARQSVDDERETSREKALSRLTASLSRKPAETAAAPSSLAVDSQTRTAHRRSRSSASAFSTGPLSPSAAKAYLAALSALKSPQLASRPMSMEEAPGPNDPWWASAEAPVVPRAPELDALAATHDSVPASDMNDAATEFEDAASTMLSHSHDSAAPALGLSLAPDSASSSTDEPQMALRPSGRPSHARSRSSGIGRFLGFSRPTTPEKPASPTVMRASSSLGFTRSVRDERTAATTSAGHSRNASRRSAMDHSRTSSTGGASDVSYTTALTHPTVTPTTPTPLKRLSRSGRSTLTDPTVASAARARSKVVPAALPVATPSPPTASRIPRKPSQPPSSYHSPTPPQSPKAPSPQGRSASAMGVNDAGSAAAKMRSPLRALVTRSPYPPPANKAYMVVDRVPVVTPPRRSSIDQRAASPEADTAVSDTEDADLPLPRRRSLSRGPDAAPVSPGVRARNRPSLSIYTQPEALVSAGRRSASNEMQMQPPAPMRAMPRRKSSAATLNIADDREFLRALEDVRRHHQDRIARRGAEKLQQGVGSVRQAMASTGNLLAKRSTQTSPVEARLPPRPRSASVDGKMPPFLADQSPANSYSSVESGGLATPLERGVGMASGRMHDGAFVNDADWKREVSSLFVIREMVQTERSYARHLESLLLAIRRVSAASTVGPSTHRRRRSSSALMMSTVDASLVGPAPHIATLRNMLPQLIALSRTLATRIDENPTAAGVGAAFRLVAPQLEATFVSWAAVVGDVMDSLRLVENGKAKSKDRIGLVVLMPITAGELVPRSSNVSATSLTVPRSQRSGGSVAIDALALTRPSTPEALLDEPLLPSPEEDFAPRPDAAKRRSTISSGAFLAAPAPISPVATSPRPSPARPASAWGFASPATTLGRRAMDAVTRPAAPAKSKSQSGASAAKSLAPADIVIQPTQRIARYQLLLNALQRNTPPQSLSHARIARALEVVGRVAGLCDTASLPSAGVSPLHLSLRPPLSYPSTAPATAATSVASDIDVPPAVPPRLRAVS